VFSGKVEEQLRLRSGMPSLPIAALADKDRIDRDLARRMAAEQDHYDEAA
jgi:hypothetical protein